MRKLIILLLFIACIVQSRSQQTDALDAFIAKQVKAYNIPGAAIGIIKNNQVVFRKGYGVTSTVDSIAVTTQTVFPIMSCTKAFTAAALGMLVDEGKVQWDDKVIQFLPDFKLSDPWITNHITIADLLSHRSGLESYEGDLLWYGTNYSRKEVVRRMQYSAIKKQFRADYGYNNVMYLVAGLIIEKISGLTWDDFIKKRFFEPLSMHNSSTTVQTMKNATSFARPHLTNIPIPIMSLDNIAPAGAVNSTIDDLLHWVQVWIDKGVYNGNPFLSENSFATITTSKTMMSPTADESYGFGWNVGFENGKKILAHGGGLPGYKSFITIIPDEKIAIIVLTNKLTYFNEEITDIIMRYLFSEKMNWEEAAASLYGKDFHFQWETQEVDSSAKKPSPIPNLGLYKGLYEDRIYGNAQIKEDDGRAVLSLLPSAKQFTGYLYCADSNRFKITFYDRFVPAGYLVFEFDKNKKPVGFTLDIDSGDFLFKNLHFKKK